MDGLSIAAAASGLGIRLCATAAINTSLNMSKPTTLVIPLRWESVI